VAIPESQLLVTGDTPIAAPPEDDLVVEPRRNTLIPIVAAVVGAALVLVAFWGIRSADKSVRVTVGLVGGLVLWRGLQKIGERRFGPSFKLGLWVAAVWMALVIFAAVFADVLPIDHWTKANLSRGQIDLPPGLRWPEPLGRTTNGYSELSHVIYGARASLEIGVIAVAVGALIGVVIGLIAGWYGKALDATIGVATNTILAFPPLILLLAIVSVYGSSVKNLALALAVLSIPTYTRLMRAQTLSIRQREYVLAARAMGATNRRLMWREVLPNAVLPVLSYSFIIIAVTIVAEASLSFLGFGIPSPQPSWGGMINDGQRKLKTDPHLVFVPAIVMFLTVLALNRIGEWTRKKAMGGEAGDVR
jgi:peptide/nickel transport system permease protein